MIGWVERKLRGTLPATIPYTDPLRAGRHYRHQGGGG